MGLDDRSIFGLKCRNALYKTNFSTQKLTRVVGEVMAFSIRNIADHHLPFTSDACT